MRCPACSSDRSSVIDSRSSPDMIRRRRTCMNCDHRFTTYERLEVVMPLMIKKDGRREPFDRIKARNGVIKACEKRPISIELIDKLLDTVEKRIAEVDEKEVPARMIGEFIMEGLKELDHVAYVRFASVYREFSDVAQFMETLEGLLEHKQHLISSKRELSRESRRVQSRQSEVKQ